MRELIDDVRPTVSRAMSKLGVDESEWAPLLGRATVEGHGDIALPCHALARSLKMSPSTIADEVSGLIKEELEEIAISSSLSGFVNLRANDSWLSKRMSSMSADPRLGISSEAGQIFASDAFAALAALAKAGEFLCDYAGTRKLPKGAGTLSTFLVRPPR